MIVVENFNNVPKSNPTNVPNAALKAMFALAPLSNSPTNAPSKGNIINPMGGIKNIPKITPRDAPIIPFLLPPHFFTPITGIK